jgi:hypothetical protein
MAAGGRRMSRDLAISRRAAQNFCSLCLRATRLKHIHFSYIEQAKLFVHSTLLQLCTYSIHDLPISAMSSKLAPIQLSIFRSSAVHQSQLRGSIQARHLFTKTPARQAEPASTRSATSAPPKASPAPPPPSSKLAGAGLNLDDGPIKLQEDDPSGVDWSSSFNGLSVQPFSKEAADVLLKPIDKNDVEIKPDGIIYLPEIKYRRILNKAFGPGGWGLAPRGETIVTDKAVTREYALLALGRLVSIARGEQDYFSKDGIPTASEGCKSNALMRCCKDLGVASELWDPRFIRDFKTSHAREAFVEHQVSKKKTKIWLRKGDAIQYPYKESKFAGSASS